MRRRLPAPTRRSSLSDVGRSLIDASPHHQGHAISSNEQAGIPPESPSRTVLLLCSSIKKSERSDRDRQAGSTRNYRQDRSSPSTHLLGSASWPSNACPEQATPCTRSCMADCAGRRGLNACLPALLEVRTQRLCVLFRDEVRGGLGHRDGEALVLPPHSTCSKETQHAMRRRRVL